MSKRTRVPRASLACTLLDDPDCIALLQDADGREAFALWCALLVAAKVQRNTGDFTAQQPAVLAALVRFPVKALQAGIATLRGRTNWLEPGDGVKIRSWAKWNDTEGPGRGGARPGAGRPKSKDESDGIQKRNQTAALNTEANSNVRASVSVSVSDSEIPTPLPPSPGGGGGGEVFDAADGLSRSERVDFGDPTPILDALVAAWGPTAVIRGRATRERHEQNLRDAGCDAATVGDLLRWTRGRSDQDRHYAEALESPRRFVARAAMLAEKFEAERIRRQAEREQADRQRGERERVHAANALANNGRKSLRELADSLDRNGGAP